jgi:presenilin-like A22 family membrane protease
MLFFGLAQALGIFVAYKFLPGLASIQPQGFSGFSLSDLLILVIFVIIFFVVAVKFKTAGSVFYKVFLTLLIFSGVQAIAGIWSSAYIATLIGLIFTVGFWFFHNVFIHNIAMILTLAGVGAIMGLSLAPSTVIVILCVFSFYDIIAVYKTGHMIKMAESMIRSQAIFGFVVPETKSGLTEHISNVQPGEQFMILGSGDTVFPLLLSASLVRSSLVQAIFVGIFSLTGLFLMHIIFINQKIKRPMAALPPIALMTIAGYLLITLLR